ncbi:uracil-DNA glycosylase [Rhodoligotrophos appendicifer]|uniref:uracil-DNA glycosylase n=1 Tax=Rhodoligotrophos appendicifer TaxID=987056 RepID=UPI0011864F08|nr:uracil-DNA glycosylase [Rhodoligotrophos appendicifer]
MVLTPILPAEPSRDCPLCPRLVEFREEARRLHPDWHNAPVPCFGDPKARLIIAGLAPGMKGANRTGRPFTGDYAGHLLYGTLLQFGLAEGVYEQRPDDTLRLKGCVIANSVRCVPPQNKPTPAEIRTCNRFLAGAFALYPKAKIILALGKIAHDSVLMALGVKASSYRFGHGSIHEIGSTVLFDSYHCSRYNTQTYRLTPKMFAEVVGAAAARAGLSP